MRVLCRLVLLVLLPAVITLTILVASLFVVEQVMRSRHPDYLQELSSDYINHGHTFSDVYGWRMKEVNLPGKLYVNSKGYRGKERSLEKTPNTTRILVLGDSIGFGFKVRDEKTFCHLLDAKHKDLDVVNLCVVGYGTDQELIKLEREGLKFNPDIVILNLSLDNDAQDNASAKFIFDGEHPKPYFTYENGTLVKHDSHVRLALPTRIAFILSQKSILYNRLLDAVGADRFEHRRSLIQVDTRKTNDYDITFRLVRRMYDVLTESGIRFMVLVYPDAKTFYDVAAREPSAVSSKHGSRTYDMCFESPLLKDVTLVNMYKHYVKQGLEFKNYRKFAYDKRFHLTSRGHFETYRIILEVLAELGWSDAGGVSKH